MPEDARTGTALALLRRWVTDYFNRHDSAACADFVAPGYTLRIGDTVLAGRDTAWLPAVERQMRMFPDLAMTVHQVLHGPGWAAAWFSEHGASEGRAACWSGVAIYFAEGGVLTSCVAQEDYMTRARQLKSGVADPLDPPANAPWDTPAEAPDPEAEAAVRDWLRHDWPRAETAVRVDDEHLTGAPLRFAVDTVEIGTLRSAGPHVAFHAIQTGRYRGGLAKVPAPGGVARLHVNGIVRVAGGAVVAGRAIRDRGALGAALLSGEGA